jgi:hypothetical protein
MSPAFTLSASGEHCLHSRNLNADYASPRAGGWQPPSAKSGSNESADRKFPARAFGFVLVAACLLASRARSSRDCHRGDGVNFICTAATRQRAGALRPVAADVRKL